MREIPLDLSKAMVGLRRDFRNDRNLIGLTMCHNVKPIAQGLAQTTDINNPWQDIEIDFPFPQLFRSRGLYLLERDRIYRVDLGSWVKQLIRVYDYQNTAQEVSLVGGGNWHVVDMGETGLLLNGQDVVFRQYKQRMTGGIDKYVLVDDIVIKTGTYFKGRYVIGGFDENSFWNSGWKDLLNSWKEDLPANLIPNYSLGRNFILWSSVGGSLAWLFDSNIATGGYIADNYSASRPYFFDMIRRNDLGWMPVDFDGDILAMYPLNNHLIVYGTTGIARVFHILEPFSTFGTKLLSKVGIPGRGAVGVGKGPSGEDVHLFIDTEGYLNLLSESENGVSIQNLGYKEFFKHYSDENIVISFHSGEREFYISMPDKCFVLTSVGLCTQSTLTTSIISDKDEVVGITEETGRSGVLVMTDTFNCNITGFKTITSVSIAADNYDGMEVAVAVKYDQNEGWITSGFVPVNTEGNCFLGVSGIDFRLIIRSSKRNVNIDKYIKLYFAVDDKRFIRGIYASSNPSQ